MWGFWGLCLAILSTIFFFRFQDWFISLHLDDLTKNIHTADFYYPKACPRVFPLGWRLMCHCAFCPAYHITLETKRDTLGLLNRKFFEAYMLGCMFWQKHILAVFMFASMMSADVTWECPKTSIYRWDKFNTCIWEIPVPYVPSLIVYWFFGQQLLVWFNQHVA